MKILFVEDDNALLTIVTKRLQEKGYTVLQASTAEEGSTILRQERIDLSLIDIGLPDNDGFSVAREIREKELCPFIFLTAMSSPEYRLEGYELGAADYIPKPFHFKELLLRIEKILGASPKQKPLRVDSLVLQPDSRELLLKDRSLIRLTEREFLLLYHLIETSPRIISREEVIKNLWKSENDTPLRAVDNTVLKLRQALGEQASNPLRSIRGAGYQWHS